jgi:hypothetical protein
MISFRIKETIEKSNIENNDKTKQLLNDTKSELDGIYKIYRHASQVMRLFDPFSREKYIISDKINTKNITNAWLKCYELLYTFDLIPVTDKLVYFDNAAFPGSFILATHHLVNTLYKIKSFEWYASSLLPEDKSVEKYIPLADTYSLYENYPDRWLMHKNNNGDLSNPDNVSDFQRQLLEKEGEKHAVNLYTCDLGIDVSNNYNNQEILHFHLNISQIVCGLRVLKRDGHMVIKHYTIFEPFTISYIALLPMLFKEVYITKPISSKRTNSEIYIVCKYYLYPFSQEQKAIYKLLKKHVADKNMEPIKQSETLQGTIYTINNAVRHIYEKQSKCLKQFINSVTNRTSFTNWKIINENKSIREQFGGIPVEKIPDKKKLRMKNVY